MNAVPPVHVLLIVKTESHKLALEFIWKCLKQKISRALCLWDPIRAGTFICEHAGEVIDQVKSRQDGEEGDHADYMIPPVFMAHSSGIMNLV